MSTDVKSRRTTSASMSGNIVETTKVVSTNFESAGIDDLDDLLDFGPDRVDDLDDLFAVVTARDDFLTSNEAGIAEEVNTGSHPDGGIKIKMSLMEHFEGLEVPKYQTHLASGFDISAAISEPIHLNTVGATAMIPTGIKLEIPPGFEAQVRPRSGLAAKHGITVTNTPGTIDADYRGEIKVSLTKVNMSGGRFKVERGMRIAQIVICPVVQPPLIVVDDLSQTVRGEQGFGSTGIN
jgi:dUTP pyrophosphatase